MASTEDKSMNAKERRLLRRAQERAKAASGASSIPATSNPPGVVLSKNGKKNVTRKPETSEEPNPQVDTAPSAQDPGSLNAKQRRLLKRAQERAAGQAGNNIPPKLLSNNGAILEEQSSDMSSKKRRRIHENPHIVFVGQLSFDTSAHELREHLENGGVTGPIHVRLLTEKGSNKSRGQAFVTLIDAENQYKCLSLHHSKLKNRVINVERSCGGRNLDKRKGKLQALRREQREAIETTCDRIVKEKTEAGQLLPGELDEQAVKLLTRYDGHTAAGILEAYCAEDRARLRNPSAYFMMLAKRVIEEGVEAVLADTATSKSGREAEVWKRGDEAGAKEGEEEVKKGEGETRIVEKGDASAGAREEAEDGTDSEEEEEERGWGAPLHEGLVGREVGNERGRPRRRGGMSKIGSHRAGGAGRRLASGDYYDISQVFGSVRGRGGFRGLASVGRGGGR